MSALDIAVKALEQLARLGNGDSLGNSDGNVIAQKAIADIAAQQMVRNMDEVAQEYAHSLALELECILYEYNGQWYERAIATLGKYREAMNAIHERESPTHMGEPFLPKDQPTWIRDAKPPVAQASQVEIERLQHEAITLTDICQKKNVRIDVLEQQAMRYVWLRDHSEPGICAFYLSVGQAFKGVKFAPETVDEAIDAAIAATKGAAKL